MGDNGVCTSSNTKDTTMNVYLGRGRHRIELELHRYWVWYRLLFIGQGHETRGSGWVVDHWQEVAGGRLTGLRVSASGQPQGDGPKMMWSGTGDPQDKGYRVGKAVG